MLIRRKKEKSSISELQRKKKSERLAKLAEAEKEGKVKGKRKVERGEKGVFNGGSGVLN